MKRIMMFGVLAWFGASMCSAENWPQFRGSNASGSSVTKIALPMELGPDSKSLKWKKAIGRGHSSPVIFDGRLYVTAKENKELVTIALDAASGDELWRAAAPYEKLESIHRIGSHATPSVATDGEHVVSFFGSSGLYCYDRDGKPRWELKIGPFNNQFGACGSPVLFRGSVIVIQDHDTGSFLAGYDLKTGDLNWKTDRSNFRRSYCSPVIWEAGETPEIITCGSAQVVAYDWKTGKPVWNVRGISRVVSSTPIVGSDNTLYVVNSGGGTTVQPTFDDVLKRADKNGNGVLEKSELPKSLIAGFFDQFDRDFNDSLDRTEYSSIRDIFAMSKACAIAIRPGGKGDVTESHVKWTQLKQIPRNPSPLFVAGALFLVKDGGIVSTLDTSTGEILKAGRISGRGKYYASPVFGDGKAYMLSERGKLSVLDAKAQWSELSTADFAEDIYASPAISEGRIFIRTVSHLYCFQNQQSK
ncbi:MAG: pyrrolo-quinoline quinone [Planctomycetaceae bacterium]|nr:pyrrolo-quinoline quinone [Planctomycetaceae bacterium]